MKTNQTINPAQPNQNQGFFAQPRAYLSKDGEYLTLILPGNMIVRKHVNFYKAILGIPFTPKPKTGDAVEATPAA